MIQIPKTQLRNIIYGRLRTQNRMSGDLNQKPWLPIRFLNKLYEKSTNNFFDMIYNRLYIIVNDSDKFYHKRVNEIKEILIDDKNGKVYVSCDKDGKEKRLPVYTSTILNRKDRMIIDPLILIDPSIPAKKAFSYIEIDHVTPIDKTLKDFKSDLEALCNISQFIAGNRSCLNVKKRNQKEIEEIKEKLNIEEKKLNDELEKIANDSYYRLILASDNLSKSNLSEYKEIYKIDESKFIAVVEDVNVAVVDDDKVLDQNEKDVVIYQQLDDTQNTNLLVTSKTNFDNIKNGASLCRLAQVPIAFL